MRTGTISVGTETVRRLYDEEQACWHVYGAPFPLGTEEQAMEYTRYFHMLTLRREERDNAEDSEVEGR